MTYHLTFKVLTFITFQDLTKLQGLTLSTPNSKLFDVYYLLFIGLVAVFKKSIELLTVTRDCSRSEE